MSFSNIEYFLCLFLRVGMGLNGTNGIRNICCIYLISIVCLLFEIINEDFFNVIEMKLRLVI